MPRTHTYTVLSTVENVVYGFVGRGAANFFLSISRWCSVLNHSRCLTFVIIKQIFSFICARKCSVRAGPTVFRSNIIAKMYTQQINQTEFFLSAPSANHFELLHIGKTDTAQWFGRTDSIVLQVHFGTSERQCGVSVSLSGCLLNSRETIFHYTWIYKLVSAQSLYRYAMLSRQSTYGAPDRSLVGLVRARKSCTCDLDLFVLEALAFCGDKFKCHFQNGSVSSDAYPLNFSDTESLLTDGALHVETRINPIQWQCQPNVLTFFSILSNLSTFGGSSTLAFDIIRRATRRPAKPKHYMINADLLLNCPIHDCRRVLSW